MNDMVMCEKKVVKQRNIVFISAAKNTNLRQKSCTKWKFNSKLSYVVLGFEHENSHTESKQAGIADTFAFTTSNI